MYSYKITSFIPQLQEVIAEAQKHLGIILFIFQHLSTITHYNNVYVF
jgi:hypothetical protein